MTFQSESPGYFVSANTCLNHLKLYKLRQDIMHYAKDLWEKMVVVLMV